MAMSEGWGQRRVEVTPEAVAMMFKSRGRVESDMPDDARLLSIWLPRTGDVTRTHTFLFESQEWGELAEGELIPPFTPTFTEVNDE